MHQEPTKQDQSTSTLARTLIWEIHGHGPKASTIVFVFPWDENVFPWDENDLQAIKRIGLTWISLK